MLRVLFLLPPAQVELLSCGRSSLALWLGRRRYAAIGRQLTRDAARMRDLVDGDARAWCLLLLWKLGPDCFYCVSVESIHFAGRYGVYKRRGGGGCAEITNTIVVSACHGNSTVFIRKAGARTLTVTV